MESLGIASASRGNHIKRPSKKNTHESKAFRCTLPTLREDQLTNLRRWADLHCAQSIVFREGPFSVVFVGLKDQFRTSASFARSIRTALRVLCIDAPLRGRWCSLISPREALSICASDIGRRDAARETPAASRIDDSVDEDIRIVALH